MESITLHNGPLTFSAWSAGFTKNPDAPLVVCLHGFPDNARSFRHQLPALADAGYRVIAPTMRGYEPSSIPKNNDFTVTTMARDIIAWLDELQVDRAHLVGHDWGALVTYPAGALFPERFHSITCIAIPPPFRFLSGALRVPVQWWKSWYVTRFQMRGAAERLVERDDWAYVRKLWRVWSPDYHLSDAEWSDLRDTLSAPGVKEAALQYYRQNASPAIIFGLKETEAARNTTVPVRTLAITGAQDGCMDTRMFNHTFREQDFPAGYRIERIDDAGHFPHLEKPEVVNKLLIDWFGSGESP